MKVILTRDVPNVGKDGEVVTVADGYARNYLFPRQLAIVAKGAAMKSHENRIAREAAKGAALLAAAQQSAETLKGKAVSDRRARRAEIHAPVRFGYRSRCRRQDTE